MPDDCNLHCNLLSAELFSLRTLSLIKTTRVLSRTGMSLFHGGRNGNRFPYVYIYISENIRISEYPLPIRYSRTAKMENSPTLVLKSKYRRFCLLVTARIEFAEVPESFYQSFKSEISTKIWFIDRAGTKIGIIMDKLDDHGYFTHGIWNVLKHYNLSDGAWLKVFYQGCNEFCIKVKDLSASKVKCPLPAKEIDFVLKYLPAEFHDFTIGADKRVFKSMERWEINLSFKQATISNMNLPADLVRRFMKRDETKEVEIEDENGNKFICNVWWGKRQNQAHLTHGWSKFCAENGLTGGSRILLAIHPNDCSKFYAKVIGS